jgi:hypothetical protein
MSIAADLSNQSPEELIKIIQSKDEMIASMKQKTIEYVSKLKNDIQQTTTDKEALATQVTFLGLLFNLNYL